MPSWVGGEKENCGLCILSDKPQLRVLWICCTNTSSMHVFADVA